MPRELSTALVLILLVLFAGPGYAQTDGLATLRPSEPVTGEITKTDPDVHTKVLDSEGYGAAGKPARGKTYVVEVPASSIYRIELSDKV